MCEEVVCNYDSYCCIGDWDVDCAVIVFVEVLCESACSDVGSVGGGVCFGLCL